MTAFPRSLTAGMGDYDFAHEKQYFNMKRAEVTVYGAEPSGVMPSQASMLEAR